jgi:Protein of unknown function (DUF4019)
MECKGDRVKRLLGCVIAACLLLGTGWAAAQDAKKEQAAVAAAEQWLTLVDAGDYARSWQESAQFFKDAVTKDSWEQSLNVIRSPLGKVLSRKVGTATFKTSLPGVPDGQYVVIQFDTSFENKKSSSETVTPMLEKDGSWRVSGYFIR